MLGLPTKINDISAPRTSPVTIIDIQNDKYDYNPNTYNLNNRKPISLKN